MRREALRESDMDIVGALFAIRFEGSMAELYIEDDGWFHFKVAFSKVWLLDLESVAESGKVRCQTP
jgi:hypothetical protein